MNCPKCTSLQSGVCDSRIREDNSIRRRRKCLKCHYRWTTLEISVQESVNGTFVTPDLVKLREEKMKNKIIDKFEDLCKEVRRGNYQRV